MTRAREAGATQTEIRDAIEVGRKVRGGAASRLDREAAAFLREDAAPE